MKKIIFIFCLSLVVNRGFTKDPERIQGITIPPPVCYGSNEVHRTYVEPPYELLNHLKSTGQTKADIIVKYDDEFEADAAAKAAFEAAVEIWEGLISSPVPIYIYAYWDELETGVLGSCGPWEFYENEDFMPKKDTYYPVALVEKMTGKEITDSTTPDLLARFNKSNNNWYFGVDGNTPTTKYDFKSVVLHEIGHGLGYTGMANIETNNTLGSFRNAEKTNYYPGIFDHYLTTGQMKSLTDTSLFKNPSTNLLTAFTSTMLFFNGPIAIADGGTMPVLYAPVKWDEGSSIYHMDEDTYLPGNANSLMTPAAAKGEAIHNPGSLSLGMLYEMGWKFIRIEYDKIPDIEKIEDLKKVEVVIDSDYDLDSTKLFLISSTDDFVNADSTKLLANSSPKTFEASLPLTKEGTIKYYFSTENKRNQLIRLPGIAPEKYYTMIYGVDNTAPTLTHQPVSFMRQENLSAELIVNAKDNLGINSVKVEYIANNTETKTLELALNSKDTYKGTLSFAEGTLLDGDSVRYKIIVEDKAVSKNTTTIPSKGFYTFYIEGTYSPVKEYFTDFNTSNRDFISSDFTIYSPKNFDNGALHSLHPYQSPEKENGFYEYEVQLKYPIIIKNGGLIAYDEVVLVEPADAGAVFGSDKFWDYVIIEGSKDDGETWLPLIDGYDSGANIIWETAYNEGISGNNSSTAGTKDMFVKRKFALNQKNNFAVGDTILIKFRLYSDPFANGWGWCIDNIDIQNVLTEVNNIEYSPGELVFYPNPTDDLLIFHGSFSSNTGKVTLAMYNNLGQMIMKKELAVTENTITENIDMKDLKTGLYFVSVVFENGQKINRKIVKK